MMAHTRYRATLTLASPLGTPLAGDTLFGQLCWALRELHGEAELRRRLDGYTNANPWLVASDGFPSGFLPRPTVPLPKADPEIRKEAKKRHWIALEDAANPLATEGKTDAEAFLDTPHQGVQSHNTISRATGTTGRGEFAPYTQSVVHFASEQAIDVWLVADDDRLAEEELTGLLTAIGSTGYGRNASVGLGKFTVGNLERAAPPTPSDANAWWTLAPCAPQGQGFDANKSYWNVVTRFGRHGNVHALSGKPFKTPVLLAATGAVFAPLGDYSAQLYIGQGLGGDGQLSKAESGTVHQGYAPVLPIQTWSASQ